VWQGWVRLGLECKNKHTSRTDNRNRGCYFPASERTCREFRHQKRTPQDSRSVDGTVHADRWSSKYLGEIERGEKRPSFEAILALAKALEVSPAVFFQFDRDEHNETALLKKIEALLEKSRPEQVNIAYRILKALLEP
jgi:transcriptional regulator with XRE-family HTH domain